MMMLATGGDPPAVPVTAGVILAVLVFALRAFAVRDADIRRIDEWIGA